MLRHDKSAQEILAHFNGLGDDMKRTGDGGI